MTSRNALDAFAVARGEGLHPKLRELFDRTAARPPSELVVRGDGMLQAGPNPASDRLAVPSSATPLWSGDKDSFSYSVHPVR
jgi:hypothetical protein